MKKVLVLLTLVAAASAFSQGTVNFVNRDTSTDPQINAPISYNAGGPMTAGRVSSALTATANGLTYGGTTVQAGLYGGAATAPDSELVLLVPSLGFRSGAAAGYIVTTSDSSRVVQGVAPGASAKVQIRAWDAGIAAASYEAAAALVAANHGVYLGASPSMVITLGGAGAPPGPPANLIGLQSFGMDYIVPEPSIIGLGILGTLAGLMVFRRRS